MKKEPLINNVPEMKRTLKYILSGLFGIMLAACIVLAFTAGVSSRKVMMCKDIEIKILDSADNSFVTDKDIRAFLDREYGRYIGCPVDSLNLTRMEDIIDGRSAVRKSQAYVTKDGLLHIDVTQRRPVIRFQKKDGGFYADAEGYIFPLQRNFTSHVQIIDGNIPLAANSGYKGYIESEKEAEWFRSIMKLVNHIENDRTWKGKIVQIHIDRNDDLIIIPREGNEFFIFGQPENIAEKFRKMEKYYTHIIPEKGSEYYKTVDLRFNGQIVCRQD